jgi:hypothetical protein
MTPASRPWSVIDNTGRHDAEGQKQNLAGITDVTSQSNTVRREPPGTRGVAATGPSEGLPSRQEHQIPHMSVRDLPE